MYSSGNETIKLISADSLGHIDRSCLSDFQTEIAPSEMSYLTGT
jgi:hypothetical protein